MKNFFLQLFTWWNGQTIGTRFYSWWHKAERVGEDAAGNVYYRAKNVPPFGERRWVIYNGVAEASAIPPGWHGWMHHRTDTPPTEENYKPHSWEREHQPNLTGTPRAYRPSGSILTPQSRPAATGDYQAWSPGE